MSRFLNRSEIKEKLSQKNQQKQPIDKESVKQEKQSREDISIDDQPNKRKRQSMKVKEDRKSKSHIVKVEEKFSSTEEYANKTSIAFLNEETTLEAATNDNQS
jgi:hypothetical protein